jgi:hypothetical protein
MRKYSEEILSSYCSAVSDTEQRRIENVKSMIKSAINDSYEFNGLDYEIFEQGSYANNTNIRIDSDIDICIMLISAFYSAYPDGLSDIDYGFSKGSITYHEYKKLVINALNKKFGNDIKIGNKSIEIKSNSYRVNADVVVAFKYRDYKILNSRDVNTYIEGIQCISNANYSVINYPKEHIKNGVNKNILTSLRYKKLVKIFKNIKNKLFPENYNVSSFLIEALLWNIPNNIFNNNYNSSWDTLIKEALLWLFNEIKNNKCKQWTEVSNCLDLFTVDRKWSQQDAQDFLLKMWQHMEYE